MAAIDLDRTRITRGTSLRRGNTDRLLRCTRERTLHKFAARRRTEPDQNPAKQQLKHQRRRMPRLLCGIEPGRASLVREDARGIQLTSTPIRSRSRSRRPAQLLPRKLDGPNRSSAKSETQPKTKTKNTAKPSLQTRPGSAPLLARPSPACFADHTIELYPTRPSQPTHQPTSQPATAPTPHRN